MGHIHSVYDTDTHFKIDATTRVVKNSPETKVMIVQHDHNSERFTFEIPRYVDGHDMSTCNVVQVHYINTDATGKGVYNKGIYEVEDLQISPDDDNVVICSWLISGNATQYVGKLSFIIRFACTTGEVVDYAWNTATHSNVHISSGINNGDEIVEEYVDILEQWREELLASGGVTDEQIAQAVEDYMEEHPVAPGSGGNVDLTGVVKSVNGQTPDETGNVEIETSGGSGLSRTAKTLLITILRNGVYTGDQSQNIDTLETVLGSSGDSSGGGEDEPTGCAIVYSLTNVISSNRESIVTNGGGYNTTLTAEYGYTLKTVAVKMGGVDVTDAVYANGVISIPSVTGIVVITATAIGKYRWIGGKTATGTYRIEVNANRAIYVSIEGDVAVSDVSGSPNSYYPVPVPAGATQITIESDGYCCSCNQLKLVNGAWTKIADTGWMALGGGTATLAEGTEAIICVAKYGTTGSTAIASMPDTVTVEFS